MPKTIIFRIPNSMWMMVIQVQTSSPGFQEMIEDIEAGYVTTVIVKDTMLHELVERIDVYHIQGTG